MSRPILDHESRLEYAVSGGAPTTGAGPAKRTDRFTDKHLQVNLAGTWDLAVEASVDGTNYVAVQSGLVSGNTMIPVAVWYKAMRVNVSVVGAANDYSVVIGGFSAGDWE